MYIILFAMQVSLSFSFRMGRSTVSTVIKETCEVMSRVLADEYVKPPRCASEWEEISKEFYQRWNFPNCVGMYWYSLVTVSVLIHMLLIKEQLKVNISLCKLLATVDLFTLITRGNTQWFLWLFVMLTIGRYYLVFTDFTADFHALAKKRSV